MLVALFVGSHAKDTPSVRLGWELTRLVQKGDYKRVTHCEMILGGSQSNAIIASSSVRDGGVRIKYGVALDPANWLIVDVPQWNSDDACAWFVEHSGTPYDWRGAWATVMPGHHRTGEWFCNEACGASVDLKTPECFTPAQFAAICFTLGRDVTAQFFNLPTP